MIEQNNGNNQLPKEINSVFKELEMAKHLRQVGIKKSFGFTCMYLFQLVFCLIFYHKNWFRLLDYKKGEKLPAKDTVCRFLNHPRFAWRRSIHTELKNGIPVKIVFVQNRNKKSNWLAILSTDCTLSEQEIVKIYGMFQRYMNKSIVWEHNLWSPITRKMSPNP